VLTELAITVPRSGSVAWKLIVAGVAVKPDIIAVPDRSSNDSRGRFLCPAGSIRGLAGTVLTFGVLVRPACGFAERAGVNPEVIETCANIIARMIAFIYLSPSGGADGERNGSAI